MKINFVGSVTQGYVGEITDEVHLCDSLKTLGHEVTRVPRDVWKAYVDGVEIRDDWVLPQKSDINIICKWHHFNNGKYIKHLKDETGAPQVG